AAGAARRNAHRDHQGTAPVPSTRPPQGPGEGHASTGVARQAEQREHRDRRRARDAPAARRQRDSRGISGDASPGEPRVGVHVRGDARHPYAHTGAGNNGIECLQLSAECGMRNAELNGPCRAAASAFDARPDTPHSALRIPHLLAGAMLLGLLPTPVGAQHPDSLPKDSSTLAPVVVTGVRLPTVREIARGLAGRTATLNAGDLDARGVRSLADALEQLPGVTTSDELGATGQLDVSLRGFQVSPVIGLPQGVTVYVDGVRANEPDAHEVNFDLLPLEDVDRVEVVYGPSVLLGRNALGAAVNLVTRRGGVPTSTEVEASAGSWDRYELKARTGARHGIWDYYVGARYEREGGWREDTHSRIGTLFAKVGLLNRTWDATLSYSGA